MNGHALLDGQELITSAWPLYLACASVLLTSLGALGVGAAGLRAPLAAPLRGALVLLGAGALGLLPALLPLLALPFAGGGEGHTALSAFAPLVVGETAAWALTALALAVGLGLAWMRAWGPGAPISSVILITLAAPGLLGPVHGAWVAQVGAVPTLELEGPPVMHLGRTRSGTPAQRGAEVLWDVNESLTLTAAAPGPLTYHMAAHRGPVTAMRAVALTVGRELSDPALPLRVGNAWSWERTTTRQDHFLFGILSSKHVDTAPAGTLEVLSAPQHPGLRTFTLRWSPAAPVPAEGEPEATAPAPTILEVYAMEGTIRVLAEGQPEALVHLDEEGACALALFPGRRCTCAPAVSLPLAGPTACSSGPRGAGSALATGLFAVLTAGLIIPDTGGGSVLTLVSARQGSGEAAPLAQQAGTAP
ncbi:MAG: hypothetical protein JXX28_02950 [Deltaproteobacteria bacterium]|nr:hypothetical protein [Deltaproteobacteria bacterium]